jgi:WD40 repeat protein
LIGDELGLWLWDWNRNAEAKRFAKRFADGHVVGLGFSADGKLLAGITRGGTVWLWDFRTRKELLRVRNGVWELLAGVALSQDGKHLAFPGEGNSVRLWDATARKERHRLRGHKNTLRAVAFAPDGKTLASAGGEDRTVRLWDVSTGKELLRLEGSSKGADAVAFAPSGKEIACGDGTGAIHVWEVPSGKLRRRMQGRRTGVIALAYAPSGKVLAVASEDPAVRLWDPTTGKDLNSEGHRAQVKAVAFSLDGKGVTTAAVDWMFRTWDAANGQPRSYFGQDRGLVRAVACSPDGRYVAYGGKDGSIGVWEAATGRRVHFLKAHKGCVFRLVFSPNGRKLASDGDDDKVRFWDLTSGKALFDIEPRRGVYGLAWAPGGGELAIATAGGVEVWDLVARRECLVIGGGERPAAGLAYSVDGRMLAVVGWGWDCRAVRIFERATGKRIRELDVSAPLPSGALAFVSANQLAFGTVAGSVVVLDLSGGKDPQEFEGGRGKVLALARSPDGKVVAAANEDTTTLLWSVPPWQVPWSWRLPLPQRCALLWNDLGAEDAATAYDAIWAFVAAPGAGVKTLGDRLVPAPNSTPETLAKLIADLSNSRSRLRRDACTELTRLGDGAVPALRQRLQAKPSLHERRLIEELLAQIDCAQLKAARAVQTLEYIATPRAKALLTVLASGAAESRLTREAAAALQRWSK